MKAKRIGEGPLITPQTASSIGENINGPTLLKVPGWVKNPLGKYYLYFAHHRGTFIRLAYSDRIDGPYTVYEPGVLDLASCPHLYQDPAGGLGHVASPEILVDEQKQRIILYYHGCRRNAQTLRDQASFAAISEDGINFDASCADEYGYIYLRAFRHKGYVYTMDMKGTLRRSPDGMTPMETGINIFGTDDVYHREFDVRHFCFLKKTEELMYVMFSIRGSCPESLCFSTINIGDDWTKWHFNGYETVMQPEKDYEGVQYPLEKSVWGDQVNVRQLRDPFMYEEDGRTYVFYTVAGECGIALAELLDSPDMEE